MSDTRLMKEDKSSIQSPYKLTIVWRNVFIIGLLHVFAVIGYYFVLTSARWQTIWFGYVFTLMGNLFGITAGAHRLWSHRSYKAKFPLRVFMMICNTIALQNDIYEWCRDHRVHHKYSETDADPHNSKRGFFFAHMGWLLCRKHPQVKDKGQNVDLSDLWDDPVVRFQRRHYYKLIFIFWLLIPTLIPYLLWSESIRDALFICVFFRYIYSLHSTWLVNSAAHLWGSQPYDIKIASRENHGVVFASFGEGYHNYHHAFPWDYSTSEWGWKYNFNFTTLLIDFFARTGLAYDLKTASKDTVTVRKTRCGDGTQVNVNPFAHWIIGVASVTWILWSSFLIRAIISFVS